MAAFIARAPIRFVATWFATVVGASACATDNVCIGDPPPTILLTAVDRFSGRDVTDSASGFARLGERRSELTAFAFGSDGRVLAIGAYLPVPGPYQVVVARRELGLATDSILAALRPTVFGGELLQSPVSQR